MLENERYRAFFIQNISNYEKQNKMVFSKIDFDCQNPKLKKLCDLEVYFALSLSINTLLLTIISRVYELSNFKIQKINSENEKLMLKLDVQMNLYIKL